MTYGNQVVCGCVRFIVPGDVVLVGGQVSMSSKAPYEGTYRAHINPRSTLARVLSNTPGHTISELDSSRTESGDWVHYITTHSFGKALINEAEKAGFRFVEGRAIEDDDWNLRVAFKVDQ